MTINIRFLSIFVWLKLFKKHVAFSSVGIILSEYSSSDLLFGELSALLIQMFHIPNKEEVVDFWIVE